MQSQDLVNRASYAKPDALAWYAEELREGFIDDGERAVYWRIADEMRNQPILDLGVGAGRTVLLFRSISANYVAVDYLPPMVELVRQRYPAVDVQQGDARDLSRFADDRFSLVVFSFNGMDSVGHEDRAQVLREVHRILKPGGYFWFSTFNMDGPSPKERPWHLPLPKGALGLLRYPVTLLRTLWGLPSRTLNYLRNSRIRQQGEGWSVVPISAHAYGVVVHCTTLRRQLSELELAGFSPETEVFDRAGCRLGLDDDVRDVVWFQILARKPGPHK